MFLLSPDLTAMYPTIVRGEGLYFFDDTGKRYLDGSSGAVVANIGHGVPEVLAAMSTQAAMLTYTFREQFANEPAKRLAERIATRWAPPDMTGVWFSSGGSEAVESAFRFARQYHLERGEAGRFKVVSTWHSYHGSTLGALAASGRERPRAAFQPYFSGAWPHIASAYRYRCLYGPDCTQCTTKCAQELERVILHEGPETVAAFVVEPVVGTTTGGTYPPPDYFPAVREICDKYGVLLIADEVMTGFGRTGERFAMNHWGVAPDIIACGKGLGCGYAPIFATILHDRVLDVLRSGSARIGLGHTYNGNPLSCAVGLAVLDYLEEHQLVARAKVLGDYLRVQLETLRELPIVGDVRGLGLMQGIELVANPQSRQPFDPDVKLASRVLAAALQRGLVLTGRTGTSDGLRGDHILVTPALVAQEGDIGMLVALLRESLREALAGLPIVTE